MKYTKNELFHGIVSALVVAVGAMASVPARASVIEPMEVRHLFVPNGFDDNDEIVVAMDGYLPDPCYRLRQPNIEVDKNRRTVTVSPMAERINGVCPDVIVPFQQVAHVGVLGAGGYTVGTLRGGKREALAVKAASTPGPDDYLYAPVDNASVTHRIGSSGLWATLQGRLTNTCLELQEVRVVDSGKTFEVLPILRFNARDPQGQPCRATESAFETMVALPSDIKPGRYLLHVRSMNGQSVNEVFGPLW